MVDDWYKKSFSRDYIRIYSHRNKHEADDAVDVVLRRLSLPSGSVCLDLCCGFGRHLSRLVNAGLDATGLDLSRDLLEYGRADHSLASRLVRGDMRNVPFGRRFDFVFSFFSSFGYFRDNNENIQVLREINRILKPGGRFLIDYLNAPVVRAGLKSHDVDDFGDFKLTQQRWINLQDVMVEKELTISDACGERSYRERVKLYNSDDFVALCAAAGLRIECFWGDFDATPYNANSNRLIISGVSA